MHLNVIDWIAVGIIALSALVGMRRGLVVSAVSLGGLVAGAYIGSRVAPHVLHGGSNSAWTPVAGLAGAVFGAVLLQTVGVIAGSVARGSLRLTPFRFVDSAGGLLFGVATGLVIVWVGGAAALLLPGQPKLRREVRASSFVRRLDQAVPPSHFLHLLARIDPFPSIASPSSPPPPLVGPTPHIDTNSNVQRASDAVVRVLGNACGVGVEGSGWFVGRSLIVTAAHVVAGERDTTVAVPGSVGTHPADVVAFNVRNDIAVLRVHDVARRPLRLVRPIRGSSVAIVGYPENGPLSATPARIGGTAAALTQDAYGEGPVSRVITTLAGRVMHGDSGAPAIDSAGRVQATIFASTVGSSRPGGYGVPASVVRRVLASAGSASVSTGACASG